jgi:hypothetical protein
MSKATSKIFNNEDSIDDILLSLEEHGLVLISDMASGLNNLYRRLSAVLPKGTLQDWTDHPTEGYFYFIYNPEAYTREQAINHIQKLRL